MKQQDELFEILSISQFDKSISEMMKEIKDSSDQGHLQLQIDDEMAVIIKVGEMSQEQKENFALFFGFLLKRIAHFQQENFLLRKTLMGKDGEIERLKASLDDMIQTRFGDIMKPPQKQTTDRELPIELEDGRRFCLECRRIFTPNKYRSNQRFCCDKCRVTYHRNKKK